MRVPHKAPEPEELDYVPLEFPQEQGLTLDDFHPKVEGTGPLLPQHPGAPMPHWQNVMNEINDFRIRFAKTNPQTSSSRCSNPDRAAVLKVYNEALAKLEHASRIDSMKINLEVKLKVSTILDVRVAEPDDRVFYKGGAFLSPLEPQYAQPRLNYYGRGSEDGDDSYYWTGYRRLSEWRRSGWPNVYPEVAIEREKQERGKRRKSGRRMLRETHAEGLKRALETDVYDWGGEVNAGPKRPRRWK